MGSSSSKPAPSSTGHVFSNETPIRFSQSLIDSLQSSPETDRTRANSLESHIQSRVSAELARLDEHVSQQLRDLEAKISAPENTTESENGQSSSSEAMLATTKEQMGEKGGKDSRAKAEGERLRELSRGKVQEEIERLKGMLGERRLREDVVGDEGVGKARDGVVRCLRVNDRRPLDCWREVERFKREVGRLEGAFLGRVLE